MTTANTVSNSPDDSTLIFLEMLRFCESSQLIYCGMDETNQDPNGYTLLMNSSSVAKEAADVLRGDWDGMNAVTIRQQKVVAIREDNFLEVEYAGDSVKFELKEREIECCKQGQYCYINELSRHSQTKVGRSIILSEKMMKTLEGLWELGLVEFPSSNVDVTGK